MSLDPNTDEFFTIWSKRDESPLDAAKKIYQLSTEFDYSPHKIALFVGAHSTEIAAYLNLSSLSQKAQELIVSNNLPITLSFDLITEDEKVQETVLNKLIENHPEQDMLIEEFDKLIYQVRSIEVSWREALSGKQIMHIVTKAKNINVLSKGQRKALFQFGKYTSLKYSLSKKQRRYLNRMLETCRDEGVLTKSCFNNPCDICEEIERLLQRD